MSPSLVSFGMFILSNLEKTDNATKAHTVSIGNSGILGEKHCKFNLTLNYKKLSQNYEHNHILGEKNLRERNLMSDDLLFTHYHPVMIPQHAIDLSDHSR